MSLKKITGSKIWPAAWEVFVRLFIFLGLPLLAWGTDDLAGFFSNSGRLGFAVVVVIKALYDARLVYLTPPHPEQEKRLDQANWHVHAFEIIFVLAAFGDRRSILTWDENLPLRWLGLGIYLVGLLLAAWARLAWVQHLRREARLALAHPVLLSEGPFQWIRYPALLSMFIFSLGFAILFRSWIGLVLLVALAAGILHSIHTLEAVFAERFPQDWPLRCRSSKRIIPFVF